MDNQQLAISLKITSRGGEEHDIQAPEGENLMVALREQEMDVEGTCGGCVSCASCHIVLHPDWYEKLAEPDEEEKELLAELEHSGPTSRLSCQIIADESLDGLVCTVAPFEG